MLISVDTFCRHISLLQSHHCIPCAVPFVPMTDSCHNWKPLPPTLLYAVCPPPRPGSHQFVLCVFIDMILLGIYFALSGDKDGFMSVLPLSMPLFPLFILTLLAGTCSMMRRNTKERGYPYLVPVGFLWPFFIKLRKFLFICSLLRVFYQY